MDFKKFRQSEAGADAGFYVFALVDDSGEKKHVAGPLSKADASRARADYAGQYPKSAPEVVEL